MVAPARVWEFKSPPAHMIKELELNKKYALGKRAFWFLFLKYNKRMILFMLLLLVGTYFVNKPGFDLWLMDTGTYITPGIIDLWVASLFLGLIIIMMVSTFERYIQHKFILGEHSFHIRRGIFMIKEKVIPYRHIQNVDIDQPYHYRLLGLAKLNMTTARLDNFEDEQTNLIPLIDKNLARQLSDFLIKQGVVSHSATQQPQ